MKQKCMINELDYCEHDSESAVVTECYRDSNCCHYCDSWYEEEVDLCPVCGFRPQTQNNKPNNQTKDCLNETLSAFVTTFMSI